MSSLLDIQKWNNWIPCMKDSKKEAQIPEKIWDSNHSLQCGIEPDTYKSAKSKSSCWSVLS